MLLQDALPGYIYARGDRDADRIDRIQGPGEWKHYCGDPGDEDLLLL